MTDKIIKALEGLKNLRLSAILDNSTLKKEKMVMCVQLADQICTVRTGAQSLPELTSRAVDSFVHLCDDNDSDVRAVADESLNRVIRVLSELEVNVLPVQVELYKEIKKNGPARCVRTALTKFAALVGRMRPSKGRAFASHITPCVLTLSERSEESVQETLSKCLEQIWPVLGSFSHDSETKHLIKAFLQNIPSENAVIRRSSATCLASIVANCRKPELFTSFTLNSLMEKVTPVSGETTTYQLLGTLNCLRALLPLLTESNKKTNDDASIEKLLQIYEFCLHYTSHRDHNIVTAALETLNIILTNPSNTLKKALLSSSGITRSYIHTVRQPSRQWTRSTSEMSVATSVTTGLDSLLDDGDVPFQSIVVPEPTSWTARLRSASTSTASPEEEVDSYPESVMSKAPSLPMVLREESIDQKENEQETDGSRSREDLISLADRELEKELDVGSFTDTELSLLFCCRKVSTFLLDGTPGGLRSDRSTRVSVKSIAMFCLSGILQLCPELMSVKLTPYSDCEQRVSDILLLSAHSDPQLRGVASVVVGSFLKASLVDSKNRMVAALEDSSSPLFIGRLLDILKQGLRDESPATSRLALSGVRSCLSSLLASNYCNVAIPLLASLPALATDSYWLNKVRLVELLCELDYVVICDITGSSKLQNIVFDEVLLPLLKDINGRVRRAAAEGLVNVIPKLQTSETPYVAFTKRFVNDFAEVRRCYSSLHLSPPYSILKQSPSPNVLVEESLSNIVAKLTMSLMTVDDKNQLFGILEALRLLSESYHPVIYTTSWQCKRKGDSCASCLLPLLISLVTSCSHVTDLSGLDNATTLIANLYAGHGICAIKSTSVSTSSSARWPIFGIDEMVKISDDFLTHVMTVLNIFTSLQGAGRTPQGRLLNLLQTKKGDKDETQTLNPHYTKLQSVLKSALANHKMSLQDSASEKLLSTLSATLLGLSSLLEMCLPVDSSRLIEEVLTYMAAVVPLRPVPVITVVLQLLRSLFSANLPHYGFVHSENTVVPVSSIFTNLFQTPNDIITERVRRHLNGSNKTQKISKETKKTLEYPDYDRDQLVTYVRLFEPLVIKSLRLYSVSGDVNLQCLVLTLLIQLVEVKVNYCVLDGQLTFNGFVKKQLELIERGQMKGVNRLLPMIFQFFVTLSYEKQNNKPLMTTPDILQLFLGLMTSDQPKETHCVPGLMPVVVDVFLPRQEVGDNRKETETQREVLLATLLKLAMHRDIIDALAHVLSCDDQVGSQIAAAVIPLISDGQIALEDIECRRSMANLLNAIPISVLTPADKLLKVFFSEPKDRGSFNEMARWLASQALLLEVLVCLKEDAVLPRIKNLIHPVDLTAFLSPPILSPDPLLVAPPSNDFSSAESLARLIILTICRSAVVIVENPGDSEMVSSALSGFFVTVLYLVQSGTYNETTDVLQRILQASNATIEGVDPLFTKLGAIRPFLTCQFLMLKGLLLCDGPDTWRRPLKADSSPQLRLVQRGAVLVLSDYLNKGSWDSLLSILLEQTKEVLELYEEAPVKELLTNGAQHPEAGPALLNALTKFQPSSPLVTERILRILKMIHSNYSGAVSRLIVSKFLRLPFVSLSRMASGLACRRLEYLLLLPKEEILAQLPMDCFLELSSGVNDPIIKQRHPALASLVNKLGKSFYQDGSETGSHENEFSLVHNYVLDEDWFYSQLQLRCCSDSYHGIEIGVLLNKLSYNHLKKLFSLPDFQASILIDCFQTIASICTRSRNPLNPEDFPLYKAARDNLLERVGDVVSKISNADTDKEQLWSLGPIVTAFLNLLPYIAPPGFSGEKMSSIVDYTVYCLLDIAGFLASPSHPRAIQSTLSCVQAVLEQAEVQLWLGQPEQKPVLTSILQASVALVRSWTPVCEGQSELKETQEMVVYLVEFLIKKNDSLPEVLEKLLRRTVMLICRLPPLWRFALNVPEAMDVEAETLYQFSVRVAAIGWTSRAQFEEIWASLLGGFNQDMSDPTSALQAGIAALEGISILMEGTLLERRGDPGSPLIDHGRDVALLRDFAMGAPRLDPEDGFYKDLESLVQAERYRPGLLSVEHLWSATQLAQVSPDSNSPQHVPELGLDITSCLQFLLDLYTQWSSEMHDHRFLAAALKTSLVLSEQFIEPSQFRTLLDVTLALESAATPSDVPLLPLCILVSAKCIAALLPGVEQYERLKDMICRSDTPAVRLATLQALLYLVQSPAVYWRMQPSRQLGNSLFYVEDNVAVTQLIETFLPLAIEILLHFSIDRNSWSEAYEANAWTLLVYLLQHYRQELGDHREELIQLLLMSLATHKGSSSIQTIILHGVERLLLADCLDERHVMKIASTAQVLIGQPQSSARRHGYQLLLTASFIGKRRIHPVTLEPDDMMAIMEKLSLLLGRLRRSGPIEVSHVAQALRYLLQDLQPMDVLTKLIHEFVSPHHPYTHILASLLFQVMEGASLPLLQDWVVFSLPSLVHGVSVLAASRTLTCLFLSASRDPWLRAAFPLSLTRGIGESHHSQLLTISAALFYSQLDDRQKIEFRKVFEVASKTSPIYNQILRDISN